MFGVPGEIPARLKKLVLSVASTALTLRCECIHVLIECWAHRPYLETVICLDRRRTDGRTAEQEGMLGTRPAQQQ
jgi:hypothetical protein